MRKIEIFKNLLLIVVFALFIVGCDDIQRNDTPQSSSGVSKNL